MTSTTLTRYDVRPIPTAAAATLRDRDDAGRPPRLVVDSDGGSPLRCCLRPSVAGERLALASYAPLRRWAAETGADPGPYEEIGPVFIHAAPCDGPEPERFPVELFASPRVVRAYDAAGTIVGGRVVEAGDAPTAAVDAAFAAWPGVALVHVRALEFGCFLFEVRGVTADPTP
jgi:hypothetical protein